VERGECLLVESPGRGREFNGGRGPLESLAPHGTRGKLVYGFRTYETTAR